MTIPNPTPNPVDVASANAANAGAAANAGLTPFQMAIQGGSYEDQQKYIKYANTPNPTSEPTVISSTNGKSVLDSYAEKHASDMAGLSGTQQAGAATGNVRDGSAPSNTTTSAMKSIGGLTAEEAKSSGINLESYNYDTKSGYFIPKASTQPADTQYEADQKKINDSFSAQMASFDAATQSLVDSISSIYSGRIAEQQDVNRRELQGYNTMNIRGGTSRYAGGVAQSILTADENAGLERIRKIANEEAGLIAQAQESLVNKKYTAFVQQRQELDTLRKERLATLKDLNDKATAVQAATTKRTQELNDQLTAAKTDALKTATKYGAPASVLANIGKATNASEAYAAAAGYGGNENLSVEKIGDSLVVYDKNLNRVVKSLDTTTLGDNGGGKGNGGIPIRDFSNFLIGKTAEQVAAFNGLNNNDKSNVYQMINGDALLSDIVSTRGVQGTKDRQKLLQIAQAIDPTFSENTNKIRYQFNKDWNSTQSNVGKNKVSINTALGHLADLKKSADEMPQSTIHALNSVSNVLTKNFGGDSSVTNFRIALDALAGELASVYKGNGASGTQEEIDSWKNALAESFSKSQFQGAMDTAAHLLSSKITASRYSYKSTMGKEYDQSVIDPDKRNELIAAGISPAMIVKENVPGTEDQPPSETEAKATVVSYGNKFPNDRGMIMDLASKPDKTLGRPLTYPEIQQYLEATGKLKPY